MNADDQRGNGIGRKKFGDNHGVYSPSASYNYSPGNSKFQSASQQQNGRRRTTGYKRNGPTQSSPNSNDRIIKQNDIIIKLLKEIRDRLPERQNDYQQGVYRYDDNHNKRRNRHSDNNCFQDPKCDEDPFGIPEIPLLDEGDEEEVSADNHFGRD